jgi:hypothetical protein
LKTPSILQTALLLTAAFAGYSVGAENSRTQSIDHANAKSSDQLCAATGGHMRMRGSGKIVCFHSNPDAGKVCSSKSECKGYCTINESSWGAKPPEVGSHRAGTCEPTDILDGCFAVIENGTVLTLNCID